MIHFILTHGHRNTMTDVANSRPAPAVRLISYDAVFRKSRLPHSTWVFGDLDRLSYWDLELAGHLYLQLKNAGARVLNNPARVKKRYALLRALHDAGLNDFNACRADSLPPTLRFPVFLRKISGHRPPLTGLVQTREELEQEIETAIDTGVPAENLVVIEYAGEPVSEGLYRRLSLYRIGDTYVPAVCAHDRTWLVKTGQLGIAGEKLYREDLQIIQTNPYAGQLRRAFEMAQIEYGRADFGFYRGRLQVFEINTNPTVKTFSAHPSPVREQSLRLAWEQYLRALQSIDSGSGAAVHFGRDKLYGYRRWNWNNLLTLSRKVE